MKSIRWLLALIFIAPRLLGAEVGLYDVSDSAHPKPLPDKIDEVTIVSQSNDNQWYNLNFRARHNFSLPASQIRLMVGDTTLPFNGWSSDGEGQAMSMAIRGKDVSLVPEIARHFHAEIQNRRHPGYQMWVEFIPDKEEFAVGEPLLVKLRITNVGSNSFAYMQGGQQRGARDNQFAFTAEQLGGKMIPDTGDPMNFGGLSGAVILKPGESHELSVDLAKWFHLTRSGHYSLRGSYAMVFVDPNAKGFETLWEDYACAEFSLQIKD